MIKIALTIAILVDNGRGLLDVQNLQCLVPSHWLASDDANLLLELAVKAISTAAFLFLLLAATATRRGRSLTGLLVDNLLIGFVDRLCSRRRILA